MFYKLFLLVFCAFIGTAYSFRCYACSFSSVDTDQSCLHITNDTHTVECPYTYCIIQRQEWLDPAGVVASFIRGCEEQPTYLNHEVEDFHFRTYFRACTSNLCNTGDGIQSIAGGALSPQPIYEGENLLVPGTGNHAGNLRITYLVLLLPISLLVAYLF